MSQRGDGIGLEITTTVVRGVRLALDEPGRVAAVCEVPISRFDDHAVVFDALVRARAKLGTDSVPTRAAWFPAGSTMQRADATGLTGPELNAMRHEFADHTGITSTMLLDVDARRWMLALRWDHTRAWRLQELMERAGFVDVAVEPGPVALERVVSRGTTVAQRDASEVHSWATLFDESVPIAATSIESGVREFPSIALTDRQIGVSDLDTVLGEEQLSDQVGRLVNDALGAVERMGELDLQLRVLDDPYPPFPSHDLRAPQRVAVALGAAVGAAGLAGRLRSVDVLTSIRQTEDSMPRPWALERLVDVPRQVDDRPGWWTRQLRRFRRRRAA